MKSLALAIAAGALCLVATYNVTREGSISVAVTLVASIGAATGVVVPLLHHVKVARRRLGLAAAFVVGALISESVVFAHYYFTYGYQDPKLTVGIGASGIEFGCIALVGAVSLLLAEALTSRITGHSSGPPTASADF